MDTVLMAPDSADVPEIVLALNASAGSVVHAAGIVITEASPGRVAAVMPVEGNTEAHGLLHGGAVCLLAETVATAAAGLHAGADRVAVSVDVNATHHRSVRDGELRAVAEPLRAGQTIASYEVVVVDQHGERVSTARVTCAVREV